MIGGRFSAMDHAYVLVNESGVYVKEGTFFTSQGGLIKPWGRNWERINATSLYEARRIAIDRRRVRFPNSHQTLGEDEPMEKVWPEAAGV